MPRSVADRAALLLAPSQAAASAPPAHGRPAARATAIRTAPLAHGCPAARGSREGEDAGKLSILEIWGSPPGGPGR